MKKDNICKACDLELSCSVSCTETIFCSLFEAKKDNICITKKQVLDDWKPDFTALFEAGLPCKALEYDDIDEIAKELGYENYQLECDLGIINYELLEYAKTFNCLYHMQKNLTTSKITFTTNSDGALGDPKCFIQPLSGEKVKDGCSPILSNLIENSKLVCELEDIIPWLEKTKMKFNVDNDIYRKSYALLQTLKKWVK